MNWENGSYDGEVNNEGEEEDNKKEKHTEIISI